MKEAKRWKGRREEGWKKRSTKEMKKENKWNEMWKGVRWEGKEKKDEVQKECA